MPESENITYDNVKPNKQFTGSRKLQFNDKNDILINANKEKNVKFAKTFNLLVFLITTSFILFISFNLINTSFNNDGKQNSNLSEIRKKRGKILDKHNEIVATSLETKDFYLDPKSSLDRKKLKKDLKQIFIEKDPYFFERIFNKNQYHLVVRDISLSNLNKIKMLGDPAIKLHKSNKRVYPQHNIFSHLTGLKTENLSSKLEKNFDEYLKKGHDIKLTLDLRIQNIVRDELSKSIEFYEAKSALAIVMDVHSGEIHSIVSLPDFNPNYPNEILPNSENNLATEARYEMGSTLKIFNAAMAYELNLNILNESFDISNGYQINNIKNISDKHIKKENLNFDEIFTKSSNVGSVKILESIGFESQELFFNKIGLTQKLEIEGLNVVSNKLPANWEAHSKFISYGYGISVSPISLVTAFSTLVNGGYKIKPKIISSNIIEKTNKILSSDTSIKINKLITKIVNKGTGKLALVDGISVGGKTGTSKKVELGNYSENKVITSFIGVFPAEQPNYLTFVLFDEPKRNIYGKFDNTGGNTAAPTFSRIVKKISPIIYHNKYIKSVKNEIK